MIRMNAVYGMAGPPCLWIFFRTCSDRTPMKMERTMNTSTTVTLV